MVEQATEKETETTQGENPEKTGLPAAESQSKSFTQEQVNTFVQKARASERRKANRETKPEKETKVESGDGRQSSDIASLLSKLVQTTTGLSDRLGSLETRDQRSEFKTVASKMGVNDTLASDLIPSFLESGDSASEFLSSRGYDTQEKKIELPEQTPTKDDGGPSSPRDPAQIDMSEITGSDIARLQRTGQLREVIEGKLYQNSDRLPHLFCRNKTPDRKQ